MNRMSIDEMRQHEWCVSWSGGKDSTSTIILMHENHIPIKEILYIRMMYDDDTYATLPVMTDFVDNAIEQFQKWGYNVRVVKSVKTAKEIALQKYKRSKHEDRNGQPYGITAFSRGMCKFTACKQETIRKNITDDYEMIGYCADEFHRLDRLTGFKYSILLELGVNECDTFDICRKYNLLSPLYDLKIKRDGCWFCPNASKREREIIKKDYPYLWEEIKSIIELSSHYNNNSLIKYKRNNWLEEYVKDGYEVVNYD